MCSRGSAQHPGCMFAPSGLFDSLSSPTRVCLGPVVLARGCICVGLEGCVCPWVYLNCLRPHNRSRSKPPAGARPLTLLLCSPAHLPSPSLFDVAAPLQILYLSKFTKMAEETRKLEQLGMPWGRHFLAPKITALSRCT